MLTNSRFISSAVSSSSKDSWAMTWHQWHAEYPMDTSTGRSSRRAMANASSPHGHQSTGLSACCRRYGLGSSASRLAMAPTVSTSRSALGVQGEQPVPLGLPEGSLLVGDGPRGVTALPGRLRGGELADLGGEAEEPGAGAAVVGHGDGGEDQAGVLEL